MSRILELRKELGLTQEEFARRLGITGSGLSNIEKGKRGLTEQMTLAICREFNVNEQWLRTGEGEMINKLPEGSELGTYIGQILMSDDEFIKNIIINYMKLDEDSKKIVRDFIKSLGRSE